MFYSLQTQENLKPPPPPPQLCGGTTTDAPDTKDNHHIFCNHLEDVGQGQVTDVAVVVWDNCCFQISAF